MDLVRPLIAFLLVACGASVPTRLVSRNNVRLHSYPSIVQRLSRQIVRSMASRRDIGRGLSLSLGGILGSSLGHSHARQMLQSSELNTINVFKRSIPSVVFIDTFIQSSRGGFSMDPVDIPAGTGSGFVWDRDGHIVTNFHVIRNAQTAKVAISDPKLKNVNTYQAKLVGFDPDKDIAVLKVDAPQSVLRPLQIGTSADLDVGQGAIAIGNPFGLDHTLTVGVVSGLGRQVMAPSGRPIFNVIQTDASINPGNSGGPLLNSDGEAIGINTAIFSPSGASSGVGFAIPIDTVKTIANTLIEKGQVLRPQLGVSLFDTAALKAFGVDIDGVAVLQVAPGSPAEQAGIMGMSRLSTGDLQIGDILINVGGDEIKVESDIFKALEKHQPGETIDVVVLRSGKERIDFKVKLGQARLPGSSFGTSTPPSIGGFHGS
ncbi:hypothetical protein AAMO2058_000543200 [Amorphochlora amoebiformis]